MSCGTVFAVLRYGWDKRLKRVFLPKIHLYYLQKALSMTDVSIVKAGYFKVALDTANHNRNELRDQKRLG